MRGFQPNGARQSAQNYADGGIVQRIKQMVGMDLERNAQIAAYRAQAQREKQAAQQAATPAPAAPQPKALSEYSSGGATQRRMKEIDSYKNGGMVRGPGTGTSDDVPDLVDEGTYIMPADSTKAIGPGALSQAAKIPVNLSNGEFKLPPEQVHAVGVQALDQMKNATHAPVGFKPQQQQAKPDLYFANGGDVTRDGNSYSGMNVTGDISVNGQPGGASTGQPTAQNMAAAQSLSDRGAQGFAPATPATPAAPAAATAVAPGTAPATPATPAAPMGWAERNAQRNTEVTASSIMDSPERRAAQASLGMTAAATAMPMQGAAPLGMPPPTPARRPAAGPVNTFKPMGFASGGVVRGNYWKGGVATQEENERQAKEQAGGAVFGMYPSFAGTVLSSHATDARMRTGYTGDGVSAQATAQPSAQQALPAGIKPSTAGAGRGAINPPMAIASQSAPTDAAPAIPNPVDQRLASGQQQAPAASPAMETTAPPTGQPNAQNMAAAQALSDRGTQGFAPAMAPANVQAPTVRHSGNDWAARNALRNAEVSASSIMNRANWSQSGKSDEEGKIAGFRAAQAADAALQGAQPGMGQAAMRENSSNQRATMQEQGATNRAGMQERGANSRFGQAQGIALSRLAMDQEQTGFQTRRSAQSEQLSNVLLDPNATPEQRKVAQRSLSALSGKSSADRMQVVNLPDTTNELGAVIKGGQAMVRTLEDGTVEQVPIGAAKQPQPLTENKQALAIKNNTSMTREQKVAALAKLGY